MQSERPASGRAFVDTNVLGYAHDARDPVKREAAIALIDRLSADGSLVISTQVPNELCAILLRGKSGTMAQRVNLSGLIEELEAIAEIVTLTPDTTREAARGVCRYQLTWYDALIWAAAKSARCSVLYTEDYQSALEIEGVRYRNPFADAQ